MQPAIIELAAVDAISCNAVSADGYVLAALVIALVDRSKQEISHGLGHFKQCDGIRRGNHTLWFSIASTCNKRLVDAPGGIDVFAVLLLEPGK